MEGYRGRKRLRMGTKLLEVRPRLPVPHAAVGGLGYWPPTPPPYHAAPLCCATKLPRVRRSLGRWIQRARIHSTRQCMAPQPVEATENRQKQVQTCGSDHMAGPQIVARAQPPLLAWLAVEPALDGIQLGKGSPLWSPGYPMRQEVPPPVMVVGGNSAWAFAPHSGLAPLLS